MFQKFFVYFSATTRTILRSLNYLKANFYKNNLEKNKFYLLGVFQYCYFGTLNPREFKLLIKILLPKIFETVD